MTISATSQGIKPGVCLSTNRPVNPFDGQVIYMTDVDQTAVWDGTQWTVLAPIAGGRNVIINGAMQVAQRGTSKASITTSGYYTADRYLVGLSSLGTWTQSIEADAPTGSGLRNSFKMLCTTADASPDAGNFMYVASQRLEGQNVQQFLKGTASAKQFAVSFWVKSNVTGTYIAELHDVDNTRQVSASYSISASGTWEKKTIIIPADTTGAFDNNNGDSLRLNFWGGAGTTFTSGTLNTTWGSITNANIAVGQTNLAAATDNYWQVTGVQLEVGAVATPFEFEDIGTTLAKCQRYYQKSYNQETTPPTNGIQAGIVVGGAPSVAVNALVGVARFPVSMRITPTMTIYSYTTSQLSRVSDAYTGTDQSTGTITVAYQGQNGFSLYNTSGVTLTSSLGFMFHFTANAEL
jgi:hypothetical protein